MLRSPALFRRTKQRIVASTSQKHSLFARASRKRAPSKRAKNTSAVSKSNLASADDTSSTSERRRTAMFNAAIECIHEHGLRGTSMEDVAARSGFSRISVYREFSNRETLIRALIVHRAEVFNAQLAKRLAKFATVAEALDHFLLTSIKFSIEDPVAGASVRGPLDFAAAGSPHHDILLQTWAPLFAAAKARGELPRDFDADAAVTWILITQFTLARLVIDAKYSAERLRQLVRSFVLPAFTTAT